MQKVVYPKLTPIIDLGFIRIGGAGLANCMLISARAYIFAIKNNYIFIEPTWGRFGPGPILRNEKDKRSYFGLFKPAGITGFKKFYYLFNYFLKNKNIIKIDSLGNYFADLQGDYELVKKYFEKIINEKKLFKLQNYNFDNVIGIHIRSGDYKNTCWFTGFDFYLKMIQKIKSIFGNKYVFYIYTDANNKELKDILSINGVQKVFFGNALADMVALSKSKLIIASDSTFSGMSAFLNQIPIIFPKRHFGEVLKNKEKEFLYDKNEDSLEMFLLKIL